MKLVRVRVKKVWDLELKRSIYIKNGEVVKPVKTTKAMEFYNIEDIKNSDIVIRVNLNKYTLEHQCVVWVHNINPKSIEKMKEIHECLTTLRVYYLYKDNKLKTGLYW